MRPGRDVELDPAEGPSPEMGGHLRTPSPVAHLVRRQGHHGSGHEYEAVPEGIRIECLGQSLLQVFLVRHLVAETEVDVFGQPSIVTQPDLDRHAALEHPATRMGDLEAGNDPFEDDPPAKAVDADARFVGLVASRCSSAIRRASGVS